MEHEDDGDTNGAWCVWKGWERRLEEIQSRGRIETIQTTEISRLTRILKRMQETGGNLLSLRIKWKLLKTCKEWNNNSNNLTSEDKLNTLWMKWHGHGYTEETWREKPNHSRIKSKYKTNIQKPEHMNQESNYWPIMCLPTIYEIITSILKDSILKFIEYKDSFSLKQKGCKKRTI